MTSEVGTKEEMDSSCLHFLLLKQCLGPGSLKSREVLVHLWVKVPDWYLCSVAMIEYPDKSSLMEKDLFWRTVSDSYNLSW